MGQQVKQQLLVFAGIRLKDGRTLSISNFDNIPGASSKINLHQTF